MEALERWFKDNGGYLHPSVSLSWDEHHGSHFRANAPLEPGTHLITVPHHLALSNLNAQVDDAFPAFRTCAKLFTVESLTFFYLATQWLHKETSFWKPYLETLPSPEEGHSTPLWFSEDDRVWLEGTDIHPNMLAREEIWRQYWEQGVKTLGAAGMDMTNYTWELYKWAATVYTSRSFNARTVRPQDTKYWTAYKFTPSGRQTVLLDLSNYDEDWKDFSILFPVMDAGNHSPTARVEWAYDPGQFSMTISERAEAGDQIFNNYGPKGNDELLMGYGFCAAENPYDGILLSMRSPPPPLQEMLRVTHPGYFRTNGEWNSEAATFRILRSAVHSSTKSLSPLQKAWSAIPTPLSELFCYIVQFERGVPVSPLSDPETYLYHGPGLQYLPRIAIYIMMALVPKIQKISQVSAHLPSWPQNPRQQNAHVYRAGQIEVLTSVQERLAAFVKALRPNPASPRETLTPAYWTIEEALDVMAAEAPDAHRGFMAGVKYCAGTTKLRKLRGTEQEEHLWTFWLCYAYLHFRHQVAGAAAAAATGAETTSHHTGLLARWMANLEAQYGCPLPEAGAPPEEGGEEEEEEGEEEADEEAAEYLTRVAKAAMFLPGSLWTAAAWTGDFVLDWGVRITRVQGTGMDVGEGDMRYVVYLHV